MNAPYIRLLVPEDWLTAVGCMQTSEKEILRKEHNKDKDAADLPVSLA